MDKKLMIEVLVADRCTENEAEKYLERGTTIFESEEFELNVEKYLDEWYYDEDDKDRIYDMIKTGNPATDWGVVTYNNNKYYIMYVQ